MIRTILITAGPTQEAMDPVRYLTNRSSGRMGYALAREAKKLGHRVILISGPTALPPPKVNQLIRVTTAREMYREVLRQARRAHIIIKVAAVADYRPATTYLYKLKKGKGSLTLRLIPNPDILAALGKRKRPDQILVGFAAETTQPIRHARTKLQKKNLDWIAVNDVGRPRLGFESPLNQLTLITRDGITFELGRAQKTILARRLLKTILTIPLNTHPLKS